MTATYEVQVRLPSGSFTVVRVQADSTWHARQLVEGMYGPANFMAVVGEVR